MSVTYLQTVNVWPETDLMDGPCCSGWWLRQGPQTTSIRGPSPRRRSKNADCSTTELRNITRVLTVGALPQRKTFLKKIFRLRAMYTNQFQGRVKSMPHGCSYGGGPGAGHIQGWKNKQALNVLQYLFLWPKILKTYKTFIVMQIKV